MFKVLGLRILGPRLGSEALFLFFFVGGGGGGCRDERDGRLVQDFSQRFGIFGAVEGPWQLDRVLGDILQNGSISGC